MREGCAKTGSIRGTIAALAFTCLILASPSIASAGWTAPVTVSGVGSSVSQTRVAGGSDGNSWVVWKRDVGGFDVIQGTRVTIDGAHGSIITLSPAGQDVTDPVLVSRADGSAMVGWTNQSGTSDFMQTVAIAADGTAGSVVDRSTNGPAGQDAKDLSIALGDDGTAGASWLRYNGSIWVAQAVMVGTDGSSGTIQDMSGTEAAVGAPDIGAAPPSTVGGSYAYRVFWPQGSGTSSNVGTRQINADGTTTDVVLLFADGAACQDPFDVNVTYSSGGDLNAFWVCYRQNTDTSTGTEYYNWSAQWLRLSSGIPVTSPAVVSNASPTEPGVPYKIVGLYATQVFGGQPVVAWTHELDGGGDRMETGRVVPILPIGAAFQAWANASPDLAAAGDPVIAANSSAAAVSGYTIPGALPGQSSVSWTRFSNSSYEPFTPTGSFLYSADPGFSVASNGKSLAAFTGIDGSSVGSARVMTYTSPGIRLDPNGFNYGKVDIGESNSRFATIKSNGQTPAEVTGISISGPGAASYSLSGATSCVKTLDTNSTCQFGVKFKPGSTASQNATVTVSTEVGVRQISLTGRGLNRTRNRITVAPGSRSARKGKVVRFKVKAKNVGGVTSNSTRICVNLQKRALKLAGNRCRSLGSLPAGATRNLSYRIRVTWRARRGVRLPVTFVMRANNAVVRQVVARVWRKGN